jgi:putative nucleotidyltransferase with HDIG domain
MLVTLFIAKNSSTLFPHTTFMLAVAPTLLATIILIIVYNQRFALAIAAIHALLVTLATGQSFEFLLTLLTGIAVFTFGLKEIRTRAKLIEVGVFASAGLFISVWALGLARMTASVWSPHWITPTVSASILANSLWASGAGILVGFITLGILPFIERVFKITTAMTLLELCDANRPLLRRLAQEAPGTFNHSLTVGIMAEAAADAIGLSGLLCRAGAYYHDVGKLSKPQYFIENQAGGPNKHDKLSPAMSLLIIVGHVKDGVELAREYALPGSLHAFIAQHHGTTLVEYFYHAAKRKQEASETLAGPEHTEIREAEFRYPGPKPQSKETAILMICDGVESLVRSIPDKSPGKMESAVHNLTMKRLMDGQFSECDLTLKELSLIETAITKALAGIYHGRVQYPTPLAISESA